MQSYFLRNSFSHANITTREQEEKYLIIGDRIYKQNFSLLHGKELCEIEKENRKSFSYQKRKKKLDEKFPCYWSKAVRFNGQKYIFRTFDPFIIT